MRDSPHLPERAWEIKSSKLASAELLHNAMRVVGAQGQGKESTSPTPPHPCLCPFWVRRGESLALRRAHHPRRIIQARSP